MMLLSYPEFSSKFQVLANSKLSFCNPQALKNFSGSFVELWQPCINLFR